jgi:hypothetical protein
MGYGYRTVHPRREGVQCPDDATYPPPPGSGMPLASGLDAPFKCVSYVETQPPMPKEQTKVTVNLSNEVVAVLKDLAERDDTTMTEVLKRAIAVQKYLVDQQDHGRQLLIEDPNDKSVRQLVIK